MGISNWFEHMKSFELLIDSNLSQFRGKIAAIDGNIFLVPYFATNLNIAYKIFHVKFERIL